MTDLLPPSTDADKARPSSFELTPDAVRSQKFDTAFRGYDTTQVRGFLQRVGSQVAQLSDQISGLQLELESARSVRQLVDLTSAPAPSALDTTVSRAEAESAVAAEEAADQAAVAERDGLLDAARREAKLILDRANDEAGRILLRARAESRGKPATVGAMRAAAAPTDLQSVVSLGELSDDLEVDDPDAAKAQARAMIAEARAVRERILTDLAKRRRTAHVQLEQLRVGREKLLETMREARRVIDGATRDLSHAEVEARLAAEAAGRRVAAEPMPSVEQLDIEVSGGRHMGVLQAERSLTIADFEDAGEPTVEINMALAMDAAADVALTADLALAADELVDLADEVAEVSAVEAPLAGAAEVETRDAEVLEVAAEAPEATVATAEPALVKLQVLNEVSVEEVSVEEVSVEVAVEDVAVEVAVEDVAVEEVAVEEVAVEEVPEALTTEVAAEPAPVVLEAVVREAVVAEPVAPEAVSVEADAAPAPARPKRRADDVFARIRAERAVSTADAKTTLASMAPTEGAVEAPALVLPSIEQPTEQPTLPQSNQEQAQLAAVVLERRVSDLELLQLRLVRQVKRRLQDDHNAALAAVRRGRGRPNALSLLGEQSDAVERLSAATHSTAIEAAEAGRRTLRSTVGSERVLQSATQVDDAIHDCVRATLGRLFDDIHLGVEAGLAEVDADAVEVVGHAFREWNTDRIALLIGDLLAASFGIGAASVLRPGDLTRWVVDHGDDPSPDCDDNSLAGHVRVGETFPTGHLLPPLGPGCRCIVLPA
jgi:DivIVA domain-containing protein